MGGTVTPCALEAQSHLPGLCELDPLVGDGGPQDIATHALQPRAVAGADPARGVEVEAVGGAAALVSVVGAGAQAQHLPAGARPEQHQPLHRRRGAFGQHRVTQQRALRGGEVVWAGIEPQAASLEKLP